MTDRDPEEFAPAWTAYWSSGALTSLPHDFTANYDGEIAQFWHAQCRRLADAARVLDLCAGNGAIALLVARWASEHGKSWAIEAIDAARLDAELVATAWPQFAPLLATITLHGSQPVETFAGPSSSFDLLVSQYGLEYCDWVLGARQVVRLLKPGGRLAMINHDPDSAMLATMRKEADDYRALADCGALERIADWLAGGLSLADLRARLAGPEAALERQLKRRPAPLVEQAWHSVAALRRLPAVEIKARRDELSAWLEQVQAGAGRLRNMLRVNEAIARQPDWFEVFVRAGLELESDEPIRYRARHAVGRARVLIKP